MRFYLVLLCTVVAISLSGCAAHQKPYKASFSFPHTKSARCDEYWLTLERLISNRQAMCRELLPLDGFPYLRGTGPLLQEGVKLQDRKALARWLEMMRSADMQARYREIDALPDADWAVLCSEAGISNCETGRLRAYTARCSALFLGDERRHNGFIQEVKGAAVSALEKGPLGGRACFRDSVTLDGTIPDNLQKALTDPEGGYRGASSLEQRLNRIRTLPSGTGRYP